MQESSLAQYIPVDITVYSEDAPLSAVWAKAFEAWLKNFKAPGTARSYRDGWRFFLESAQLPPWKTGRAHVVTFLTEMREKGLSDSTVHSRLAALSSFYDFVCRDYTIINEEGREIPLYDLNPASSKFLRKRMVPYAKSNYMVKDEIKRFLAGMDQSTIQGSRDYALFLAYLLTGRRSSEVRNLKWGDLSVEDGIVLYRWSGKNVESSKSEMARPVYEAILAYLDRSGRRQSITKDDYIFTATNSNAKRLPVALSSTSFEDGLPLTGREIGKLLHKYARLAGITKPLTCHSLRHSATMMRRNAGESMEEVSKFLTHVNFATTQIYLHSLEGYRDRTWRKVGKMLEL